MSHKGRKRHRPAKPFLWDSGNPASVLATILLGVDDLSFVYEDDTPRSNIQRAMFYLRALPNRSFRRVGILTGGPHQGCGCDGAYFGIESRPGNVVTRRFAVLSSLVGMAPPHSLQDQAAVLRWAERLIYQLAARYMLMTGGA